MAYVKNNEIQTRIALKYDTYENWTTLNPILLEGEVAFATVADNSAAGFQNQPNVIIKVGDGTNHFNDLKTVSALAADVYAWAKEATKPSYDAKELAYTDNKFTSSTVEGVIAEIANELSTLTGGASGSIASQIANAINALDVAAVTAGTGEVIGGVEQVDGKIVVTKKTLDKTDIPTIEMTQVNGLSVAISDAQTNAVASAKTYSDSLAVNYDAAGSATAAETAAKAYADGLAVNYDKAGAAATALTDAKTYADGLAKNYDVAGSAATAESNAKAYADSLAKNYDAAGSAAAAETAAKAYADGLAKNYDAAGAAAQALTDAKAYTDTEVSNAIGALDVTDNAVTGQFVTAVSQEDGKITVTRADVDAANVVINTAEHPNSNVATAIDNLKTALSTSNTNNAITLTESTTDATYAKVYTLTQGTTTIGNINIPKDLVLKSGRVDADGNIILVLNDANNTEIVVDAKNLIEYVTSGSNVGDMVVINIDADHKVTASITDGTVTKAKLDSAVQASLDLADSALQKADITTDTANGTIAVEGVDVAVKGLHAIAFDGDVKNLTQTADSYIVFKCGSASVNI